MTKQVDIVMPSDQASLEKIRKAMIQWSNDQTIIEAKRDQMSQDLQALVDEFDIPKRFFNKMARTYHRQNFQRVEEEANDFFEAYTKVMGEE